MKNTTQLFFLGSSLLIALAAACSDSDSSPSSTGTTNPGPGGSAGTSGSSGYGGSAAGGTDAGGTNAGGSDAGGSDAGGSAGSNLGGSAPGGSSSSAGAGGTGTTGGSGAGAAGGSGPVAGSGGGGAFAGQGGFSSDTCTTEVGCVEFKTKPGEGAVPPAKAGGNEADGPVVLSHAVSRWFLGDTDRNGKLDPDAWKDFGFDLDGWSSTKTQGFHCMPAAGGKASEIRADGNKGIDNSFGKNVVNGILATLVSSPSDDWSAEVVQGHESYLFDLGKLGSAASYDSSPSQIFWVLGQQSNGAPVVPPAQDWSGYAWRPVLNSPDNSVAPTHFPGAYLAGNVWVSGEVPSLDIRISFSGYAWTIPVQKAWMALDVTDRNRGVVGNLGGVVAAEEIVTSFKKVIGNFGTFFCDNNSALEGISESIRQSSDILLDGTQDPTKTCGGISIGLGFETRASKLGGSAPAPVEPDPCAN